MDELERTQRAAVVAEAESWLRTPYHHCADIKGHGVDCALLLVRVYVDTGIVPPFDPRPYSPQWHLHNTDQLYLRWIHQFGHRVAAPKPGDVAIWLFGLTFSHGAIVISDMGKIVHATLRTRKCCYGDLADVNLRLIAETKELRPVRFYSPWGEP